MKNINLILLGFLMLFTACEPTIDYGLDGDLPPSPEFAIEEVEGDPNRFVIRSLTENIQSLVWDLPGGSPANSTLAVDTVTYTKKGTYEITLHITALDGNGNSFSKKPIEIAEDAAGCPLPFLFEDCTTKCWKLSPEPSSVLVGPVPYSGEWFDSPDITDTQADDRWCFSEDGVLEYNNNGSSFSACQGFVEDENYPIPASLTFSFSEGGGFEGQDQIVSNEGFWMGIEDTGPEYNIVSVSETTMVLLTPIKPCDGSESPGWFTLTFFAAE